MHGLCPGHAAKHLEESQMARFLNIVIFAPKMPTTNVIERFLAYKYLYHVIFWVMVVHSFRRMAVKLCTVLHGRKRILRKWNIKSC